MNTHTISIRPKSEIPQHMFLSTAHCINLSRYNIRSNAVSVKSSVIQTGLSVLISRSCVAVTLRNGTALKRTVSVMKQEHSVEVE